MNYLSNEVECRDYTDKPMKTNLINRVKESFKLWLTNRKEQTQLARKSDLRERFVVDERGGQLYILCNGTAVKCMSPDATAQEICDTIDVMRIAAIEYDNNGND